MSDLSFTEIFSAKITGKTDYNNNLSELNLDYV